jgi:hypothetical protein
MSAKDIENQMNEFREYLLRTRLSKIYKGK